MSKIRHANKKIEKAVVSSYKKVENSVVGSYKKIEDKFVDIFLRNDDETIEEAKIRVKKEQQELEEKNRKRIEDQMKRNIIDNPYINSYLKERGEDEWVKIIF